jgi:predicted permease
LGVFGNSNSLPISLVISLSMTITGLHWNKIPGDNDEEVAARGILYLLIFQQLGQLVRWSWGYHVLLAPPSAYKSDLPNGNGDVARYRDDPVDETEDEGDASDVEAQNNQVGPLVPPQLVNGSVGLHNQEDGALLCPGQDHHHSRTATGGTTDSAFDSGPSGGQTPESPYTGSTPVSTQSTRPSSSGSGAVMANPTRDNLGAQGTARFRALTRPDPSTTLPRWLSPRPSSFSTGILVTIRRGIVRFLKGLWGFMNPPLWAMLIAVIVASVPQLQKAFFTPGTFVQNSVTRAVAQTGNVAVPLILVVLGANLAGNTQPKPTTSNERHETKLLIAALVSRMVLPFIFVAPLLAVAAKYLNVSILDDPIFVIVCFLLAGAPSALQLAQICQLNGVYESVMAKILFWSYVVVILPSTLIQVVAAIEAVEWAM